MTEPKCCGQEKDPYTGFVYETCDVHGWRSDKWRFPCPVCQRQFPPEESRYVTDETLPEYSSGTIQHGILTHAEVPCFHGTLRVPVWREYTKDDTNDESATRT